MSESSRGELRQHWIDALAAFGARIEVEVLPDHIEHHNSVGWSGEENMDRPTRIRVVNRQYVTGPVLVEIDEQRDLIAAAFSRELTNGGS